MTEGLGSFHTRHKTETLQAYVFQGDKGKHCWCSNSCEIWFRQMSNHLTKKMVHQFGEIETEWRVVKWYCNSCVTYPLMPMSAYHWVKHSISSAYWWHSLLLWIISVIFRQKHRKSFVGIWRNHQVRSPTPFQASSTVLGVTSTTPTLCSYADSGSVPSWRLYARSSKPDWPKGIVNKINSCARRLSKDTPLTVTFCTIAFRTKNTAISQMDFTVSNCVICQGKLFFCVTAWWHMDLLLTNRYLDNLVIF